MEEKDPPAKPDSPHKANPSLRLVHHVRFLHGVVWGRFVLGLLIACLVLLFKWTVIERLPWYDAARLKMYGAIQGGSSGSQSTRYPVVLVDITNFPKTDVDDTSVAPGEMAGEGPAVRRKDLYKKLTEIVAYRPKAIAVDVDFSPDSHGNPITLGDSDFFADCKRLSETNHVPIFLGVDRHAPDTSANWLGSTDFSQMAVGLAIGNDKFQGFAAEMNAPVDKVLRMFCWTQSGGTTTRIRSLAFALSQSAGAPGQEPPAFLRWALEFQSTYVPDPSLETTGFVVDYDSLNNLRQSKIAYDLTGSPVNSKELRDRIVILGELKPPQNDDGRRLLRGDDLFRVPGNDGLFSGALLHACAVNSLIEAPWRKWTRGGAVAADVGLVILAISLIEFLGWVFFRKDDIAHRDFRIHWSVAVVISLAVMAIALPLAKTIRIVWDDAIFVAFGLLLHTGIDHFLARTIHPKIHAPAKPKVKPEDEDPAQKKPIPVEEKSSA